jgi:hypothetical protein
MCLPRLFEAALETITWKFLTSLPLQTRSSNGGMRNTSAGAKSGWFGQGNSRKYHPEANAIDRRRSVALQELALAGLNSCHSAKTTLRGIESLPCRIAQHERIRTR